MGTDRSIEYQGPCLCGKGTFRIDYCEVDHGWPTATPQWYETYIQCSACSKRFSLQRRDARFVLIERSLLREREQRSKVADSKATEILADSEVRTALKGFERLMSHQRSVAAVYRLLTSAGLEYCSVGTFRRHWAGAQDWIKKSAMPSSLVQIFKLVGMSTQRLKTMLAQLAALQELAQEPAEPHGKPVYLLPRQV